MRVRRGPGRWYWRRQHSVLRCLFRASKGTDAAVEFVSGYLVEGSLSVDNLFVFLLLFRSLGLNVEAQRRVLLWGVLGAIVLRGSLYLRRRCAAGTFCLGAVRLRGRAAGCRDSAWLRAKHQGEGPQQPGRWLRRRLGTETVGKEPAGAAFLLVVLAVEGQRDLLFALDSIPAVLAITRDPFIVYTSNIFAILGLRSLYFALAGVFDRLRLLRYGLAVILIFVAAKMLAVRWITVPAGVSLVVILVILGGFAVASRLLPVPAPSA